jgi:hypothetical protein
MPASGLSVAGRDILCQGSSGSLGGMNRPPALEVCRARAEP